ncbi:sortase A [Peptoniphilus stercorisuis]|uniref:Sortase A n=2 Tax=Peptoniphilus stercorisuis TaxID=1436965 RepID=A0ABS4KBX4_9FIRM|nr:sortase A [Peptoniphilus stercorisuis]
MMNKKTSKGKILMAMGILLIGASISLVIYNLWQEQQAGAISNKILEQMNYVEAEKEENIELEEIKKEETIPSYILNPNMEMPTKTIDENQYIGVINVPKLELSLPIMSDWSASKLKISPNRYKGSVYTDDIIIAGHNYRSHFGGLAKISPGEELIFTDIDGNQFHYIVDKIEIIKDVDIEGMESGEWDLTLFTCTYDGTVGSEDRLTIRGKKIQE